MEKITVDRAFLEEIAGEYPMNQDEMGGCVWCGEGPPNKRYGYAERNRSHHASDCPWVLIREAMGDTLPD